MLYIGIVPASPHSQTLYSVGEYIYLAFGMAIIFQELWHLSVPPQMAIITRKPLISSQESNTAIFNRMASS